MKNLFLGIRQYDCDADWDKLIHIANNSCPDNNYAGFQTKFFNHPVLNSIKDSFISCCRDYYKINKPERVRLWYYHDWKDNPNKDGHFWHDHYNYYGLSGILYLTLPEGSTTTGFSISADSGILGKEKFFDDMMYLPSVIHKWFIFPANLPHIPGTCNTEQKRIVISGDYWYNLT